MDFSIIGGITNIETFAVGRKIRELARLRKQYRRGRWRKRKGIARVQLADGTRPCGRNSLVRGDRHCKKEFKIKRYL